MSCQARGITDRRVGVLALIALIGSILAGPPPADAQEDVVVNRIAGATRIETAVQVARQVIGADRAAQTVVLARADDPADAFAATSYAAARTGVVLLTGTSSVPQATLDELDRLLAPDGRVVLAGGEAVIGPEVESALAAAGHDRVERIAGTNRYDTAVAFARAPGAAPPTAVLVADGNDFRVALPAAATAAGLGGQVVLSAADALPTETAVHLRDLPDDVPVIAAGGSALRALQAAGIPVDDAVAAEFPVDVAVGLADLWFGRVGTARDGFTLASSATFPDALAGGVLAAATAAPLLLTPPDGLAPAVADALAAADVTRLGVLGGEVAVPQAVVDQAVGAAGGTPPPSPSPPPPPDPDAQALAQARAIPGQRAYAFGPCPGRPDSPLVPADADCTSVLATDLDGDGTAAEQLDIVIMYQRGAERDGTVTVTAYTTALGTLGPWTAPLYVPPGEPDGSPSSGYATECLVDVDEDPARELLLTTGVGANTVFGIVLDARSGTLAPVGDSGIDFEWTFGGGVRFGSGYRIAPDAFVLTSYDDESGSPYGWRERDYPIIGGEATYVGYRSGSTSHPGRYGSSGCPGGSGTFPPA